MTKKDIEKLIIDYGNFRYKVKTFEELIPYENNLINKLNEAINYTRCSLQLKGKKAMTFEEWVESEGYTEKWDGYFKNGIKSTYWMVKGKYVMYTNELSL